MAIHVDALSSDIGFWLNEACTKNLLFGCEDLSYLLLSCIQISPVTSHKSQPTNFVLKAQCTTPQSLNICETKTAGHVVVVYQNTATEEFLCQTSFICCVCVKAHEWYTSTVEQQNLVTRKSWWSACCVSILEWIQHKSHAL